MEERQRACVEAVRARVLADRRMAIIIVGTERRKGSAVGRDKVVSALARLLDDLGAFVDDTITMLFHVFLEHHKLVTHSAKVLSKTFIMIHLEIQAQRPNESR